jgi:oligopeptide transport system substrate-binding protein
MYIPAPAVSDGANGLRLTLDRSKYFWGARPQLREVVMDWRPADEITKGDVIFDGPGGYSQQHISGDTSWRDAPVRAEAFLVLDPNAPGLNDLRVRQALALALDKTALATSLDGQATNHITPPHTGAYPATLGGPIATAPLTGDVARAQALWQSHVRDRCGGVASRCPVITLYYTGWLTRPGVGSLAVSSRWMSALPGLRVNIEDVPDILVPVTPRNVIVPLTWYEDYPDPQDWLSYFAQEPGASIQPIYHEASVDTLVARAEATRDPTTRLALYRQAENMLLNDAVVIPVAQESVVWQTKPTVVNFPADPKPFISPSAWAHIYLTAPTGK